MTNKRRAQDDNLSRTGTLNPCPVLLDCRISAGTIGLGRLVDAAIGMPKVDDITRPEWDWRPIFCAARDSCCPSRMKKNALAVS